MLYVEIRKYITTPLFWILNAIGVALLAIQSFVLFGADQVGLLPLTALDYLLASMNFYITYLLPFLYLLFVAYMYTSEIQWRTLMFPFFDGIPRWKFIAGKIALASVALFIFIGFYLLLAIIVARAIFPFGEIYLENRLLSPGETVMRVLGGTFWMGFVLCTFGMLAILLAVLSRHLLVSGLGAALSFYALLILQNSPSNPFAPLFAVARQVVQVADLSTPAFLTLLLRASLLNLGLMGIFLFAILILFERKDISLG